MKFSAGRIVVLDASKKHDASVPRHNGGEFFWADILARRLRMITTWRNEQLAGRQRVISIGWLGTINQWGTNDRGRDTCNNPRTSAHVCNLPGNLDLNWGNYRSFFEGKANERFFADYDPWSFKIRQFASGNNVICRNFRAFFGGLRAISVALADRFTKHICQAANITRPNVESAATIPGQFQPFPEL